VLTKAMTIHLEPSQIGRALHDNGSCSDPISTLVVTAIQQPGHCLWPVSEKPVSPQAPDE
jgi:hypothetical protein